MKGLIIPKRYVPVPEGAPLVFLAGPITDAPDWQDSAVDRILKMAADTPDLLIASPKWGVRPGIADYVLPGDESYFVCARDWERHYFDISASRGVVMMWLPGRVEHHCEKSYALMTSNEFGEIRTRYRSDRSTRFCIGTDGRFPELPTFSYDLLRDCPDKPTFLSLDHLCGEALRLVGIPR